MPIEIPKDVTFTFSESDKKVTVKGPKGTLFQKLDPDFKELNVSFQTKPVENAITINKLHSKVF